MVLIGAAFLMPAFAQYRSPGQLDNLVSRIALYPDPLLMQVLTAATYPGQIPDAASWADEHSNLTGDQLARAIEEDNVPWDASVVALLPFPSVLDRMDRDRQWTGELGEAVLDQRPDVMDAVQRMRMRARDYGYLRDSPQFRVVFDGGWLEILPARPGYIYAPVYDPYWVYAPPRPGFSVGISFGPQIFIGATFARHGWADPRVNWRERQFYLNNRPWTRAQRYTPGPSPAGGRPGAQGGPAMQGRPVQQGRTVEQGAAPSGRTVQQSGSGSQPGWRPSQENHQMSPVRPDRQESIQRDRKSEKREEKRDDRRPERRDDRGRQ